MESLLQDFIKIKHHKFYSLYILVYWMEARTHLEKAENIPGISSLQTDWESIGSWWRKISVSPGYLGVKWIKVKPRWAAARQQITLHSEIPH